MENEKQSVVIGLGNTFNFNINGLRDDSPGFPDWAMAEEAVCQYWQAIINRQYGLAKHYCIPDGVWITRLMNGRNI